MKEFIDQLSALLQSGALDKKSLVVVPRMGMDLRVEVPQSFFRDWELIEAVQAAKSGKLSVHRAADTIRRAVRDASKDVYESVIEGIPDEVRARQIDAYLSAHGRTFNPALKQLAERVGRPLELPDPQKFLSKEVIRDLADQKVVDFFEVVEVSGPAVVKFERSHYGSSYWAIKSLREELVELMREMESK